MRRLRLLIVDDEPDMLDFLERVFRHEYDVLRAQSGGEALQALAQAEVDILLTDQKMPRMTGIQLAVERCQIHQYVVKPVDSDRLRQAVREACERRTTSDWTFTLGRERD